MKTVDIEIKVVFGKRKLYPANALAHKLAEDLLGQKTFTVKQIGEIKSLGHTVRVTRCTKTTEGLKKYLES